MKHEVDSEFQFFVADRFGSTMDLARRVDHLISSGGKIFAVGARQQLKGRGRHENVWLQAGAEATTDIPNSERVELVDLKFIRSFPDYFFSGDDFLPVTFVVPSKRIGIPMEWFTLAVGCAVSDAVAATTNFVFNAFADVPFSVEHDQVFLKWPNDLVWFHQGSLRGKICGILCETSVVGNQIGPLLVGIGLNFFAKPSLAGAESLWELWKSMAGPRKHAARRLSRLLENTEDRRILLSYFARALMMELEGYLCVPRSPGQLRSLALSRSIPLGTQLAVENKTRFGKFAGINLSAGLILEDQATPILAGDVEVMKRPSVPSVKESKNLNVSSEPKKRKAAYLAVDFGNTRVHFGFRGVGETVVRVDCLYSEFEKGSELQLEKRLRAVLAAVAGKQIDDLTFIFSSVKDKVTTKQTLGAVQRHFERMLPSLKLETFEATSHSVLGIAGLQGHYNANNLGVDRALRFYFASQKAREIRRSVAVVSAGTAMTCEAVSADGQIIESLIGPGLSMALDALHEHTAKLPSIEWDTEALTKLGVWDTRHSMMRGVAFAESGAVVNLVLTHGISQIFVSGGDAEDLCSLLEPVLGKLPEVTLHRAVGLETDCLLDMAGALRKNLSGHLPVAPGRPPNPIESSPCSKEGERFGGNLSANRIAESMSQARRKRFTSRQSEVDWDDFRRLGARLEKISEGRRLDSYLAEKFKFHTRDHWQQRIMAREICVQPNAPRIPTAAPEPAVWVKHTYRLKNNDQIWLYQPREHEPDSVMHCDVIGDDGDVIVFSKPGNLVIHAVGQYSRNTFLNVAERMGYGDAAPIHRIDRETSGLLVCARSSLNRRSVADAFRDGEMQKMYLAVSKLSVPLPDRFRVTATIGDAVGSKIRLKLWVGGANPMDALTHFVVLSRWQDYALIACFPKTGRTNQIRIHLAAAGAWIVGDKMYFPNEDVFLEFYEKGLTDFVLNSTEFPRHMLHNVAIQGPSHLPKLLSERALVCPLPEDFSAFSPMSHLLAAAGIPADSVAQSKSFENIFRSWVWADFSDAPDVPLLKC